MFKMSKSETFEHLWNNLTSYRRWEIIRRLGLNYKITYAPECSFGELPVKHQLDILHSAAHFGLA